MHTTLASDKASLHLKMAMMSQTLNLNCCAAFTKQAQQQEDKQILSLH